MWDWSTLLASPQPWTAAPQIRLCLPVIAGRSPQLVVNPQPQLAPASPSHIPPTLAGLSPRCPTPSPLCQMLGQPKLGGLDHHLGALTGMAQ